MAISAGVSVSDDIIATRTPIAHGIPALRNTPMCAMLKQANAPAIVIADPAITGATPR